MRKHTILFLAADSSGTEHLALDREARAIHTELKRSGFRDRFEFVTRWAAEPLDPLRELRELRPTVVHFSGRSGPNGLFFQGADGGARLVLAEALAATFGAVEAPVKLVVLNGCYSEPQAEALLAHVDHVVGTSGSLHADAARIFAVGFYGGLGERESVAAAYRQGLAAISLEGLPAEERPQLKVRAGVDASQLILAVAAPKLVSLSCPYPGMRPYVVDDASRFYGRDAEVDDLLGRLRAGEREIYVIGPSGSGKSSLVAAGMLPQLARGAAGLGPFVIRPLRPGEHPMAHLAEALEAPAEALEAPANAVAALLTHRAEDASVMLVIDQLEELFTPTIPNEHDKLLAALDERRQFLAALQALRTERRCVVVFTLRADFFGDLMDSALWTDHRRFSAIEVGPLRGEALREAIVRPAADVGVVVEPALIERLLADAGAEPGCLPLLQETLFRLWDRREDHVLALSDYQTMHDGDRSGLAVALSLHADATLRKLTAAQEVIARRILLRLISFGEGHSDTRRQQRRSELRTTTGNNSADFAAVLERLVADRLLTVDDNRDDRGEVLVDLAHDVMITAWPTLASWIKSRRADEQRRRELEAAAVQWIKHGREGGLLDPVEVDEAEAWMQAESAREIGWSDDIKELVSASKRVQTRLRWQWRGLVGGLLAALAIVTIVVILAIIAYRQAHEAKASRNEAEANRKDAEASREESQRLLALSHQEAGRQLVLEGHSLRALPYLVKARKEGLDGPPLRMLFWEATRALPVTPNLEHQGRVKSALFSPDGTRVVTASKDKTARVWNAITGKPLSPPLEHQGPVVSAAFSPDGTRVVTASDDKTARVWDAATGKPLTPPLEHEGPVVSAVFSPDSTRVVTASGDETAQVWDATTGKLLATPLRHPDAVLGATFSPDGTRVVTASSDKTARIWNAGTGNLLAPPLEHQDTVFRATFSSDGTRVVTASSDKTARVWDATTGQPLTPPLEHRGAVMSAAFSPDGTRIVTASVDNTARIWDAKTGNPLATPLEHRGAVVSAAFSSDGTRVVTLSRDTAWAWDAATGQPFATFEHQDLVESAAFSPDGTRVVTASDDKTAQVWDVATDKLIATPLEHQGRVWSAAFSPDGTRIITASDDNTARVWDAATGKPLSVLLEHQGSVLSAAFSPDGARVATTSADWTARIWDAVAGKPLAPPLEHYGRVVSAAFSPDGTRVVTASYDDTARIWDAVTGKPLASPLEHQGRVESVAFSPNGTRVVTASWDWTARLWDVATGKPLTPPLEHQGGVWSAAFSPDGTRVVTASADRTARVWDAATGKPLVPPLEHQGWVVSAAFSPDGTRIVTASWDRTARIWGAATGKLVATPLEHPERVGSATFSPDGTRVVTASWDNAARVWDAATGKPLTPPLKHLERVVNVAFSPNNTWIVTASWDKTARVWDVRLDRRTLAEWSALAEQSPFMLGDDGVFLPRGTKANASSGEDAPEPDPRTSRY